MDKLLKLTELEMDALREVGNIGIGNGATAFSKIINKSIKIVIPDTKFIPLQKFSNEFGGPEKIITAIYLQIGGDLEGEVLFFFSHSDSLKLIDMLNGRPVGTTKIVDELGMSALKEMSNIFCGAYLTALSDLFNLRLLPSIPHTASDMMQSVLDFILVKVRQYAENILTIKTQITIEGEDVAGDFMLFFHVDSYKKLLIELAKKYGLEDTK
jgi:chemotaxis protein CheC